MCVDMGGSHFRERGFTGGSRKGGFTGVHKKGGSQWGSQKGGLREPCEPPWLRACVHTSFLFQNVRISLLLNYHFHKKQIRSRLKFSIN